MERSSHWERGITVSPFTYEILSLIIHTEDMALMLISHNEETET